MLGDLEFDVRGNDLSKATFDSLASNAQAGARAVDQVQDSLKRMDVELSDTERRSKAAMDALSRLGQVQMPSAAPGGAYGSALSALGIPTSDGSGGSFFLDAASRRFRTGNGMFASLDTVLGSNPSRDDLSGWTDQLQSSLENPELTDSQRKKSVRDLVRLQGALQRLDTGVSDYAKNVVDQSEKAADDLQRSKGGNALDLGTLTRRGLIEEVAGGALGNLPGGGLITNLLGSGAASASSTAVITGIGAAAIAASEAIRFVNDALAETDRRRQQVDLLSTTFDNAQAAIQRTQEAIGRVASRDEITTIFLKIDKNSVLADSSLASDLSAVTKELSYRFGQSWKETTAQVIDAVNAGNGDALEKARIINSSDEAMLRYADSIGKTVPQLTAFERQQALVNAVLSENQRLLTEPDSGVEQRLDANAHLTSSWHDLKSSFQDWVASLLDPSATGAIDYWAQKINDVAAEINKVEQKLNNATDERRVRAKLPEAQLAGYDALSSQTNDAYNQYIGALYEKQVASGDFSEEGKRKIIAEDENVQRLLATYERLKQSKDAAREAGLRGENILNDPSVQEAQALERAQQIKERADQLRYEIQNAEQQSSAAQTNLQGAAVPSVPGLGEQAMLHGVLDQKRSELQTMQSEYQKALNEYFAARPANANAPSYAGTTVEEDAAAKLDVGISQLREKIEKGKATLPELQRYQDELDRLMNERERAQANADSSSYANDVVSQSQNANALKLTLEAEAQAIQSQIDKLQSSANEAFDKALNFDNSKKSLEDYNSILQAEIAKTTEIANQAFDAGDTNLYESSLKRIDELYKEIGRNGATLAALPANTSQLDYEDSLQQLQALNEQLTSVKAQLASLPDTTPRTRAGVINETMNQLDDLDRRITETKEKIGGLLSAGAMPQGEMPALLAQLSELQQQRAQVGTPAIGPSPAPAQPTARDWLPMQDSAQSQPWLAFGWTEASQKEQSSADEIKAMFGQSVEAINAANEALNGLNIASPTEMMSKLAEAENAVAEAESRLVAARATGNQGLEEQAQRNLALAEANRQQVQAIEEVAAASAKLAEARKTGTTDEIAAAEGQMQMAQAYLTGTNTLVQNAQASVDAGAALRLYRDAQASYAAAVQQGNAATIAQTQAQLNLAASLLNSATASNIYNSANSQTVQVAGILLDRVTGLPVAFDMMSFAMQNGATNTNALNAAMASLDMQLQRIEASAANAAFSIAQRLVPAMGVGGSLQWATDRAGEIRDLRTQFESVNQQQVSAGKNPFGEQVFQMFAGELQSGWNDQANQVVSQLNKVGAAGTKTADVMEQVEKRVNSALDGMIKGVMTDSTKGLIDLDSLLPREDAVDENARRMADVAVKGFKSPWYDGLKDLFPEDVLKGGEEAVKRHAAQMVRNHQEGLTTVFYDTNRAADLVIEKLRGAQEQQKKIAEIREAVKAKGMDASDLDIAAALGIDVEEMKRQAAASQAASVAKNMGNAHLSLEELKKEMAALANGDVNPVVEATRVTEDGTTKIKENAKSATKTMGEAMVSQISEGNYGQRAVLKVLEQFNGKQKDIETAGKSAGNWWATSALDEIVDKFPPGVLDILVRRLGTYMVAAENGERTAGNGGGGQ